MKLNGQSIKNRKNKVWKLHESIIKHKRGFDLQIGSSQDLYFNALALCGETGELANLIKKEWRGDLVSDNSKQAEKNLLEWWAKVEGEIADVLAHVILICGILKINPEQVLDEKLPEVQKKMSQLLGVKI